MNAKRHAASLLLWVLLAACASTPASPTAAGSLSPAPSFGSRSGPSLQTYVIASGDTFSHIAEKFGVTVEELLAANPSIDHPDRIAIGDVINIPVSSHGTVIRIEGPDYLHPRLNGMPELVLIGDPSLAGEAVEWQIARVAQGWSAYNSDVIDATGRASMRAVDAVTGTQQFRAHIAASVTHPELWSQTVTLEWGGSGPCPAEAIDPPKPIVAPDGTTYELVPTMDRAYNSQWSIVASHIGGRPGTGWAYQLEPCWEPGETFVGSDGTGYITWWYQVGEQWASKPAELVVAGPEGVRARMPAPAHIEAAPGGTLFVSSLEVDDGGPYEPTFRSMTVAALGPDGNPRRGWPFTTTAPSSWPVYGPDGTLYLAQSTEAGDRIIALGPDGQMKSGWPYAVPGRLEWTVCGAGCANVPDAPLIAPDGSIYDNFNSGIYMVGADGRPIDGWPYLLPKKTSVPSACREDTPGCDGFDPVLTNDGRIYLPRTDERYGTTHEDMICLLLDGSLCQGWPVRLPNAVDNFEIDEHGTVHVWLIDNRVGPNPQVEITLDGTILQVAT
jgi:hypothetical protein